MELRVLRYFLAVVREGSITAAAQSLHMTQPTLSKQLMELEDELGKQLFVRGKHRVRLTEAGEFMYRRAQEIVDLADRMGPSRETFPSVAVKRRVCACSFTP